MPRTGPKVDCTLDCLHIILKHGHLRVFLLDCIPDEHPDSEQACYLLGCDPSRALKDPPVAQSAEAYFVAHLTRHNDVFCGVHANPFDAHPRGRDYTRGRKVGHSNKRSRD